MATRLLFGVVAALGLLVAPAGADEYWIAYEGNDFPENEGWSRMYGEGGAERSLVEGHLVLDTTADPWIYEYYEIDQSINPDPGEVFVAEWRLSVQEHNYQGLWDPTLVVARDPPDGDVIFSFGVNELLIYNDDVVYELSPGFHAYRFVSADMIEYRLYVDGELLHESEFDPFTVLDSFVAFGPGLQGASSYTTWDYVRFGVIPEPRSSLLLIAMCLCAGRRAARRPGVLNPRRPGGRSVSTPGSSGPRALGEPSVQRVPANGRKRSASGFDWPARRSCAGCGRA
jgi:hypothetical protein